MKSKKFLLTFAALTMSAMTALAFSACDDEKDNKKPTDNDPPPTPVEHVHTYGDWQVTAPTRTEDGSAVKVCEGDSTHKLTETLPNLNNGKYAVAEAEDGFTFTYKTASNETFVIDYKPFGVKVSADDFTFDEDGGAYTAEVTFTAVASESFTVNSGYEDLYVFDDKDSFDSYIAWEDDYETVTPANYTTVAGQSYTFWLAGTGNEAADATLWFEAVPLVYAVAESGENTVELNMYEKALFVFTGDPETEYSVELDGRSAAVYKLNPKNNFEYEFAGSDEGFTTDSDGKLFFMVTAEAKNEYTFTVAESGPVTGIEVKDDEGKTVTEYTLYVNEDDGTLLEYVKLLPAGATNQIVDYEIDDETVAVATLSSNEGSYGLTKVYLKGVSVGSTMLTVTSRDNPEVKAEITLNVELKAKSLAAGDNNFGCDAGDLAGLGKSEDMESVGDLTGLDTAYRFTGEPVTKYVITFEQAWGYAWKITDASNENNYLEKWDTKVTFLEVTTGEDGYATVFVSGNGAGVLTVTLGSEYKYPTVADDDPYKDSSGVWHLQKLNNTGISVAAEATFFEFTGEPETKYTFTLSEAARELGQVDASGAYLTNGTSCVNKVKVVTDETGVAYVKAVFDEAYDALQVNLAAIPYDEDKHGWWILNEGTHSDIELTAWNVYYYVFEGEANTEYSVVAGGGVSYIGQCGVNMEWMTEEGNRQSGTFTLTTDENGKAYIRVNAFSNCTLSMTICKTAE